MTMTVHDAFPGSPGAQKYPKLFSRLTLRGRTIPNRIVSTPHATGWGHDGLLAPAEVDYHVRKAAGGAVRHRGAGRLGGPEAEVLRRTDPPRPGLTSGERYRSRRSFTRASAFAAIVGAPIGGNGQTAETLISQSM